MKEAENYKCYKRLLDKQYVQVSGLNDIPLFNYLRKYFTQTYGTQYGDATSVLDHPQWHQHSGRKSKKTSGAIMAIALPLRASI